MITIKSVRIDGPIVNGQALVSHGFDSRNNQSVTILRVMKDGDHSMTITIDNETLDKMIAARDSYARETAHRGYPIRS